MKRKIIKLKFLTPVHLGEHRLTDSAFELRADTIFSALCLESQDIEGLVELARRGKFKISDAFPYVGEYYYLPKPMVHVEQETADYKLFKKIKYITEDTMDSYLAGTLEPIDELENFVLGEDDVRTSVRVGGDPYQLGVYSFYPDSGLYIIVEYDDDVTLNLLTDLFDRLQYTGIGGRRSSGLGRFEYALEECFEWRDGEKKILLNSAMAADDELDQVLAGANYLLQKRAGFIHQSQYKKKDFYTFKAGSVFDNTFAGDIYDVGNDEHPVYRYAIALFMGVS